MCHRICYAMEREPLASKLGGRVEADETYFRGRQKGHRGKPGPANNKKAVVSLVEREGDVRSHAVANVGNEHLHRILDDGIDPTATLVTDECRAYTIPGRNFAGHETIRHSSNEYVRGDAHTNTVEGYFAKLKRSLTGTYIHVSREHLHRYLAELDYRHITRKVSDRARIEQMFGQVAGKRWFYR